MEANTARFASILLLLSVIAAFASASASTNSGYGKSQLEGYTPQKPDMPEGDAPYEKINPKMPTKSVNPKGEHVAYEKTDPKVPTKPVMPEEEHVSYKKSSPKWPTKPVMPKEKHNDYEKTNPKFPTKPVIPRKEHDSYEKNSPKTPSKPEKPFPPKVLEHPKNIAVQGLIYCIYGSKLIPLQGATTRVICSVVHKNGYRQRSFSFLSRPADEKGYFLAKIQSSKLVKDDMWKITECKAFLKSSPWSSCKVPEDTNGGINGARVTFSRHLNRDGYCLSSVGPFIYNPGHASSPKEGY